MSRLLASKCTFLLCDIQEKLIPAIHDAHKVVSVAQRMLTIAEALKIPVITTEQYPKGLGRTAADLKIPGPIFEKTQFSMMTEEVRSRLPADHSVVLFGFEAHVCILQTVKDLLKSNHQIFLLADGVSCRFSEDKDVAIQQMRHWDVTVTTSESVIFELLQDSNHPQFKLAFQILKSRAF